MESFLQTQNLKLLMKALEETADLTKRRMLLKLIRDELEKVLNASPEV